MATALEYQIGRVATMHPHLLLVDTYRWMVADGKSKPGQ